ncbi:cytochrome P450 6B5-like [Pectinophora gossypiella]|uniref:cytochrome P450 6B5-like n=1 Tax=Pectinophora gossypiella TaxID=13191 RepID=UPI00214F33C0|nr:cytochrome P450 6B5-like [Pectinophora gossypiella]
MILFVTLLGLVLALGIYYILGSYNEFYWKKRGVRFYSKNKLTGPLWEYIISNQPTFTIIHGIYKKYRKEPIVGIGQLFTPTFLVIDKQNIQHVLQSDFQAFNHRGTEISKSDVLNDNILFMHGLRWKLMRQNMTPLFTAAKLKDMYYILDKSAQDFMDYLKNDPLKLNNLFDTFSTFCSAAIGAAVFGITTKSTFDSPFLKMSQDALAPTLKTNIKFTLTSLFPNAAKVFGLKFFGDHESFFIGAIKQVIRQREKEHVKKHDFADICVSLQKKGKLKDLDTGYELEPTDEILAAQAFFFFLAGVEPTAASLFATFLELGRLPDILEKVQNEIDNTFEKYNGQMTYEAIAEMEYVEKVYNEALRMYPPIGILTRQCVKDSVLPVGNIKVSKGTKIFIPVYSLHHDPETYPNPHVFDPERFASDQSLSDISYMGFGKGNRLCIGMRYAKMQAKAGIVHLLRNFSPKTTVGKGGIQFSKQPIAVRPINVNVQLIPRKIKSY